MKVLLYKDKSSYYMRLKDIKDVNYSYIVEDMLYDENYVPIGRIATDADIQRAEDDYNLEWNT